MVRLVFFLGLPFLLLTMVLLIASPMVTFAKSSSSNGDNKGTSQQKQQPTSSPDKDCAFNPDGLAKCKPDAAGNCPAGFSHNVNNNCIPCPKGFERKDNDETGKCFPIEKPSS